MKPAVITTGPGVIDGRHAEIAEMTNILGQN